MTDLDSFFSKTKPKSKSKSKQKSKTSGKEQTTSKPRKKSVDEAIPSFKGDWVDSDSENEASKVSKVSDLSKIKEVKKSSPEPGEGKKQIEPKWDHIKAHPISKVSSAPDPVDRPVEVEKPKFVPNLRPVAPPAPSNRYVPPSLRGAMPTTNIATRPRAPEGKEALKNLASAEVFPSLKK